MASAGDDQPAIESAPTPSIKSLKSKFEQLAQENSKISSPLLAAPKLHSTSSSLSQQSCSRQPQDEQPSSSCIPNRQLHNTSSHSDLASAQKRAPPPPPPSRSTKKSNPSPVASPLLRPVPVPVALKSPHASPDRLSVPRLHQDTEDDAPRGGGVASLRERFA